MGTVPRVKFKMCEVVLPVTDECNSTSVTDTTSCDQLTCSITELARFTALE